MPVTKERLSTSSPSSRGEIGRLAEIAFPIHADVRCKLALDLVAKAEAELDVVHARPDAEFFDFLRRKVDLQSWLENHLLRDRNVVFGFEPRREIAVLADKGGSVDLEEVGREPLHAEDAKRAFGVWLQVIANADLGVEEVRDLPTVQRLDLGPLDTAVNRDLAFRLEPEPVDVAAHPALCVPIEAVVAVGDAILELLCLEEVKKRGWLRRHCCWRQSDQANRPAGTSHGCAAGAGARPS